MGPNPYDWCHKMGRFGPRERHAEGRCSEATGKGGPREDRGVAAVLPHARAAWNQQKPPVARRELPLGASEEAGPCRHLVFRLLASRRVTNFCWSGHSVYGALLWQPWETHTGCVMQEGGGRRDKALRWAGSDFFPPRGTEQFRREARTGRSEHSL